MHQVSAYRPACALCLGRCAVFVMPAPVALAPAPDITRNFHKNNIHSTASNPHARNKQAARARILELIISRGMSGATCEEIELALDLRHQSASARISELKADGEVTESGSRTTSSGGSAGVLRARVVEDKVLHGQMSLTMGAVS